MVMFLTMPALAQGPMIEQKDNNELLPAGDLGIGIGMQGSTPSIWIPWATQIQATLDFSYLRFGASYWNLLPTITNDEMNHAAGVLLGPRIRFFEHSGPQTGEIWIASFLVAQMSYIHHRVFTMDSDSPRETIEYLSLGPTLGFQTTWANWKPVGFFLEFQAGAQFRILDIDSEYDPTFSSLDMRRGVYLEYALLAGVAIL